MGGANPDETDFADLEREICRLPDVEVVRVVADEQGLVSEVHVVARPSKPPKQIVRDVQAVAMATFGVEIDHRTVSVAQVALEDDPGIERLEAELDASDVGAGRTRFGVMHVEPTGLDVEVRVLLVRDSAEAVGTARGSVSGVTRPRLVAGATLGALQQLDHLARTVDVAYAEIARVGSHHVAIVILAYVTPPAETIVSGSAVVGFGGESEAIARAVLDATNRRLARTPAA